MTNFYEQAATQSPKKSHLKDTKFWQKLMKGIYGPRAGDARIIIDSEDSSKGTGKTGLAVFLAKVLSGVFDYNLQDDDLTLSGAEYLERVREHPGEEQPSVVILDELAGAGAGHAYREMSHQNVELGNWWQLMRKKRTVTIVTLPHWSKASKSMRREAEFRLHCLKEPIGYFKAYEVGADFDDGSVKTHTLDDEPIQFPDIPSYGMREYRNLDKQKDTLLASATTDADTALADGGPEEKQDPEDARKEEREAVAQRMRDNGATLREAADVVDMSRTWVMEHTD
jgi:hypothetical protein